MSVRNTANGHDQATNVSSEYKTTNNTSLVTKDVVLIYRYILIYILNFENDLVYN